MSQIIEVDPVTRVEGHGRITVWLDDQDRVSDARFQVTQFRGFEKFCEGRPFGEMPSLVERICGICPISHSLASAKACDAIMGVRVPRPGVLLRRLANCAQFIQSHALSFFHLSSPDFVLGMAAEPETRNLFGMLADNSSFVRDGIRLRQIGQQIIAGIAGKRIHPAWVVPGGVNEPLKPATGEMIAGLLPEAVGIIRRTLDGFKTCYLDRCREEISAFANFPTLFLGLTAADGTLEHMDGALRVIDAKGNPVLAAAPPEHYDRWIGERVEPFSYLKSPYYKPMGYPEGIYRVGPASRLNLCSGCGTPLADQEWAELRSLERGPLLSSFYNHHARLVEILACIEAAERLLADPAIFDPHVRAYAQPNFAEGVGVVEAPRGTLIHHYRTDDNGLITWVNMIVATGHNNLAMNKGVLQTARRFIHGSQIEEGALNRLQAVIRAFDPCLSCSTHVLGSAALDIRIERRQSRHAGQDRC
jgi:NAD-reducing hydrogenase large subunit